MIRDAGVDTSAPFLFIGILSSQRTFRRRITVTATWLQYVTHTPTHLVEARFVLTPDEVRHTVFDSSPTSSARPLNVICPVRSPPLRLAGPLQWLPALSALPSPMA